MIKVKYDVTTTRFGIRKLLKSLENYPVLSLDTETAGVYPKNVRKEAADYLKKVEDADIKTLRQARQVAANSGLSYPSLVKVTHFVFGISDTESKIIICRDAETELLVWRWVADFNQLFIVHNALYDLQIMYHRLGVLPKCFEDSQLYAKSFINNAEVWRSKVGLKELMGGNYDPSWSLFEDYEPDNLKDKKFLDYTGIDGAATLGLWNELLEYEADEAYEEPDVSLRPYQHLPMPYPAEYDPGPVFFYKNFVKAFIPDMIKMMSVGLDIDEAAVEDLRETIDQVQESVKQRLADNPLVQKYQESIRPAAQKAHAEAATAAVRKPEYYLKPFKEGDMVHRTWAANVRLKQLGYESDCQDKWPVADLRKYNIFQKDALLQMLCEKTLPVDSKLATEAMQELAEYKAELWNRPRYEKAAQPVELDPFNPGSHKQVSGLFEMLGITPLEYSKDTGMPSWNRKTIEALQKSESEGTDLYNLYEAMIDDSFSSIIKNNFLAAFDRFTVDGVLHGKVNIFGAKSFRNTSNSPNLLNMPSTRSIYAKPLKRCFKRKEGFVIYTADLSALEDRVIANLSGDENKQSIFTDGLDGHSLNACGYFPDRVKALIGEYQKTIEQVKAFMALVDTKDKLAEAIRQESKAPTFKLAYGGFPDADKGGVITQEIFDNYHNVLYPGITDYRENYVLKTAKEQGYIHLGLGCRLYSSDPGQHIRTLHNATIQFWSILTLIAINELNYRAKEAGYENDILVQSTIYDSIYVQVREDPVIIKWLNDTLIELMTVQYLEEEAVSNEAEGELGFNWADLKKVPNNASVEEIAEVLESLYE